MPLYGSEPLTLDRTPYRQTMWVVSWESHRTQVNSSSFYLSTLYASSVYPFFYFEPLLAGSSSTIFHDMLSLSCGTNPSLSPLGCIASTGKLLFITRLASNIVQKTLRDIVSCLPCAISAAVSKPLHSVKRPILLAVMVCYLLHHVLLWFTFHSLRVALSSCDWFETTAAYVALVFCAKFWRRSL